jgi:hypothetical protein
MAKFTDLTPIAGSSMTTGHVFAVSTSVDTFQLSLDALEQSFTGLTAKGTSGISFVGNTVPSGITVADNGFVGINDTNPNFVLDVGDYGAVTHPEFRMTASSSSRSVKTTIADSGVYWQSIKKASDTDYYIQVSEDGSNYTGALNIDKDGNVGIFNGGDDLTNKFYVSGGDVKFQSGVSGMVFDPGDAEIKTSVAGDILCLNRSNSDDILLGNGSLYVSNNSSNSKVGVNTDSPSYSLEVEGINTIFSIANPSTSRSRMKIANNSSTSYISVESTKLLIGPNSTLSSNNLVYDLSSKKLGVGSVSPDNKLHVYSSTDDRVSKFEGKSSSTSEVFQVNNFNNDEVSYTGPRHTVYTFGRSVGTGPSFTNNQSKWGIGLFDDGVGVDYDDVFVFRVDADTSSNSSIKAELDRDGNFNIQGSYTTSNSYSKGKFVQNYHSRCISSDIYINPFSESSATTANVSSSTENPFAVAPFAGEIKKIKIITADVSLTHFTNGARFEISVVNPSSGGENEQLTSFTSAASSAPTSLPSNGVVAQFGLQGVSAAGTVYSFESFSGSAAFTEGQLVQYRICQANGSATDINSTIMSTVSFTVD